MANKSIHGLEQGSAGMLLQLSMLEIISSLLLRVKFSHWSPGLFQGCRPAATPLQLAWDTERQAKSVRQLKTGVVVLGGSQNKPYNTRRFGSASDG